VINPHRTPHKTSVKAMRNKLNKLSFVMCLIAASVITFWCGLIYIVLHFVFKYW